MAAAASASTAAADVSLPCIYCVYRQFLRHPKFVYLLSDSRLSQDSGELLKGPQHIGLATHPYLRLRQHNREKGYHTGAKPTNLHGPYWQLEIIIGPFYTKGKAFRQEWRESARGMESRYRHAYHMVCEWNKSSAFIRSNHPRWDEAGKEEVKKSLDSIMCISSDEDNDNATSGNDDMDSATSLALRVRRLALSNGRRVQIFCRDIRLAIAVFGTESVSTERTGGISGHQQTLVVMGYGVNDVARNPRTTNGDVAADDDDRARAAPEEAEDDDDDDDDDDDEDDASSSTDA
jgi:hypothetical protein